MNDLDYIQEKKEQLCRTICSLKCMSTPQPEINKRCMISNISNEQLKYIFSPIGKNIFLKACPGSGKTEVIGLKFILETQHWKNRNSGIAVLTFTNSAEKEVKNRIKKFSKHEINFPHFVGTFTSWLHGYIANPFVADYIGYKGNNGDKSLRLIESDNDTVFLTSFSTKYSYESLGKIKANKYHYCIKNKKFILSTKIDKNQYLDNQQDIFDRLIEKDSWRYNELDDLKKKFWKKGMVTYEDVEFLVYEILCKETELSKLISKRFPIIWIDECQDLSLIQILILNCLEKLGSKLHFIGDLNQSIYGFRHINPEITSTFLKKKEFDVMELTKNYRSFQPIVNICQHISNDLHPIMGMCDTKIGSPLQILLYEKDNEIEIIEKFKKTLEERNLDILNSKVIVRNGNLAAKLKNSNSGNLKLNNLKRIAVALKIVSSKPDINNYKNAIQIFGYAFSDIFFKGSFIGNKDTFYCPEEIDKKNWRIYLINFMNDLLQKNELMDFNKNWADWKNILIKHIKVIESKYTFIDMENIKSLRITNGEKAYRLSDTIKINEERQTHPFDILTIHGSKGMSLDGVLFISSYNKPPKIQKEDSNESGAYWEQWFDSISEVTEKNRLAYVACSRPKYLLALGIPYKKNLLNEAAFLKLKGLGFDIIK